MSPEVFQRTQPYTMAADIFSLALVYSELLTGQVPLADVGGHSAAAACMATDQVRPTLPLNCNHDLRQLVEQGKCLCGREKRERQREGFSLLKQTASVSRR